MSSNFAMCILNQTVLFTSHQHVSKLFFRSLSSKEKLLFKKKTFVIYQNFQLNFLVCSEFLDKIFRIFTLVTRHSSPRLLRSRHHPFKLYQEIVVATTSSLQLMTSTISFQVISRLRDIFRKLNKICHAEILRCSSKVRSV